MKDIIEIIKSDKRARVIAIFGMVIVFTFTLGLSLSAFSNTYSRQATNIIVNGLSFNITTNGGSSNDRILKLKAGSVERFSTVITNKNSMNVKYELIYEYCGEDSECSNPTEIPSDIVVGLDPVKEDDISGEIESSKTINLLTSNQSSSDKYIRLSLNAGYSWNDLALVNQIGDYYKDITFIAYVDGVEQEEFPNSCNYSYTYKTYVKGVETTDSEVSLSCSNNKWDIYVSNIPSRVEVYFSEKNGVLIEEYIASLDKTSNGLEEDTTTDKNLRYVGASPNNYIKFNDETWRIIGVFDETNAETEQKEQVVKIIKEESIGNYSWDSNSTNDWENASLQTYLNGDYYNGLNVIAKTQISKIIWHLGGWSTTSVSVVDMYKHEGDSTVYSGRPITWENGKIALMYPSDWGYASTNTSCRAGLNSSNCKDLNWLYTSRTGLQNNISQYDEWFLSPISSDSYRVFYASSSGYVGNYGVTRSLAVRPTLYLKSTTLITGGTGTSSDPYTIE